MTTSTLVSLPTLSARSVALSVLLGSPGGELPVRDIIATGEMCGIAAPTMRVALSRLVGTRELSVRDTRYALSAAHRERQAEQARSLVPHTRDWDGSWEVVVVVETGRDAAERARLRATLAAARLAELREGVWMRPANLERPPITDPHVTNLVARPSDPAFILERLWDVAGWAETGRALLAAAEGPRLDARRFAAAAALIRHIRTDPMLPAELQPADWPAQALRDAYDDYRTELHAFHLSRQGDPA